MCVCLGGGVCVCLGVPRCPWCAQMCIHVPVCIGVSECVFLVLCAYMYMGHASETGTSGHLTCFLLRKALKMLYS